MELIQRLHQTEALTERYGYIATPSALFRALDRSLQVKAIRDALATEEISERQLEDFTETLLLDLTRGEPFRHDLLVAAIAVALRTRNSAFAETYIAQLAALELSEMAMSIRVARECSKDRKSLATTKRTELKLSVMISPSYFAYDQLSQLFSRSSLQESQSKTSFAGA